MNMDSVIVRVQQLIVEALEVDEDEVTMEASFKNDLGADSLEIVELVMSFEDEFDMEIDDEEAENLHTVGDVVRYIEANLSK